ncbi:MAG TPA: GntR family transcriptional regulator [Holophagaceae bacterium]|nr:GntR family transcriptional regulator [Holophagaceae bacterium]
MRDLLRVDPRDAAPIWRQIEEGVRRLVATRALDPGDALPSVRDLARDLRVNPATVAKAYLHLVEGGVLATRKGEGTFVADAPAAFKAKDRRKVLLDAALRFASASMGAGADLEEAQAALSAAWSELRGKGGKP